MLTLTTAPLFFYFYVRLQAPRGYQPKAKFRKYFVNFTSWIHIRDKEAYQLAVTKGHWRTLGSFHEVLTTLLGQHLLPQAALQVFRDEGQTELADEEQQLQGRYYIVLPFNCKALPWQTVCALAT
ncbi:hypothetical protein GGX14DRAFT_404529 [Mycena pura]|uniref:Uncharacterized protein n=1 Tax=Mycena pura TaxID=153505 RepID=A0AAD6V152_9AGAR|nr:hypothetical protein GGX14DRAFT_404529 [Mycena pura]